MIKGVESPHNHAPRVPNHFHVIASTRLISQRLVCLTGYEHQYTIYPREWISYELSIPHHCSSATLWIIHTMWRPSSSLETLASQRGKFSGANWSHLCRSDFVPYPQSHVHIKLIRLVVNSTWMRDYSTWMRDYSKRLATLRASVLGTTNKFSSAARAKMSLSLGMSEVESNSQCPRPMEHWGSLNYYYPTKVNGWCL